MSSFDNVKRGKLVLKGGLTLQKSGGKKRKKVRKTEGEVDVSTLSETKPELLDVVVEDGESGPETSVTGSKKKEYEIDDGTGFAPDGKKSKKYEDLFPVETKRFGFSQPAAVKTREDALLTRVKQKADRYCK